jgi:putative FmdB family regulatory protein
MPIYAYRCERCGHELDALQKISEPVLTDCPACGEASLQKKLTAPGFQLKGSGWYQTDFRGGAKPAAAAATDAPSETKAESKTESKSDTPAPSTGCGSGCSCH